jgi:hypothetical protein
MGGCALSGRLPLRNFCISSATGETGHKTGLIGNRRIDPQGDLPFGAVLRAAVQAKLKVEGVIFPTGRYLDIGTPEALSAAPRIVRFR